MTTPMFPDATIQQHGQPAGAFADGAVAESEHSRKIRRSTLWAAYGDALGWISELTDEAGLKRRTGGEPLHRPIAWERRIGGRSGVTTSLPTGCYSDDTQLRLATGRAIRPSVFDVEAFARVELPIWLSYALGGGKGTTAAATNLSKPKVPWFANTFKGWTESGGNGAAMRIQPHVWAARTPDAPESFLLDVVRNTICTHSHPTGILGAVIHALTLAHTVATGHTPSPDELEAAITTSENLPELMQDDFEIWNYWRAAFEQETGPFVESWKQAIASSRDALRIASVNPSGSAGEERYASIVNNLMMRCREHIGNGILTAIAAVGLTWCETQPEEALRIAVNEIGTDTDTIATMAGAILGVTSETEPPVEVLDADLLRSEADRLSAIAEGRKPPSHRYPDLLHWAAPKTRSDALLQTDGGRLYVSGLGLAEAQSEPMTAPKGDFMWQWLKLETGQTLLLKRRPALLHCSADPENLTALPVPSSADDSDKQGVAAPQYPPAVNSDVNPPQMALKQSSEAMKRPIDLPGAVDYITEHIRDDKAIGHALRGVVTRGTRGQTAAFTAALIDLIREAGDAKAVE